MVFVLTQPPCLHCLCPKVFYYVTKSLTQHCSAQAASTPEDSVRFATSDTVTQKNVTSYEVSFLSQMT